MTERLAPILLIEDEPDDVALTLRAIAAADFKNPVHTVRTMAEARGYLSDASRASALPALVILDLGLPDGRGYELLDWIRQAPDGLPGLRVIVLTISGSRFDEERAQQRGALIYLRKPVEPQLLTLAIARLGLSVEHTADGTVFINQQQP